MAIVSSLAMAVCKHYEENLVCSTDLQTKSSHSVSSW